MKITNTQLVGSIGALARLANISTDKVRGMYAAARAKRLADEALRDFMAAQEKLVQQYAARHADGSVVYMDASEKELPAGAPPSGRFKIADVAAFNAAMEELGAMEIEIDVRPITLDELGTPRPAADPKDEMRVSDFVALTWLLTDADPAGQ